MGTYEVPLGGEPTKKLDQLKRAAAQKGIDFKGTVDQGNFSGMGLRGQYRRDGEFIIVTITKVPFLFSETFVIDQIKDFLSY